MRLSQISLITVAFTSAALLAGCSSDIPADSQGGGGTGTGTSNTSGTGSSTPTAGTTGSPSGGAAAGNTSTGQSGSGVTTGGVNNNPGTGGTPSGSGGSPSTAGTGPGPGTGGVVSMGGGGPDVDQMGKKNASPGDKTTMPQDYLRIGEIRLLNNNWGSAALGCNTPMSVFINTDNSFGWDFDRGDCDKAGSNSQPDFPQIEFGVHPFGKGSDLATSPDFSSTTLLPIQVKNLTSASMTIDTLNVSMQAETSWDITFEFWLSQRDPSTADSGVYSELMTFWGWQNGRWPDAPNGKGPMGPGAGDQITAGSKTYKLWVQDDNWSGGKWRYFQFRANDGPQKGFNGTLDIKPLVDYLIKTKGYSTDYWITRFEVGTEIDDNTKGSVSLKGITFEVNGQKRSQVFTPK